jgi:uncharacterized delta-60 repeat protein
MTFQCSFKLLFSTTRLIGLLGFLIALSYSSARGEELDLTFPLQAGANNTVYTTALQTDGKILIGGLFTKVSGVDRRQIARLNADGSLDESFNPGRAASVAVYSIVIQPDGKILVGGSFNRFNNAPENGIIRLNQDGSQDLSFIPGSGTNATIRTIALQSDGQILIGGDFTVFNALPSNRIARLNSNGSLDQTFAPSGGANASVEIIALKTDGKILLGGAFTNVNSTARSGIAQLNSDGSLNASFNPGSGTAGTTFGTGSNRVYSIAQQSDGKLLLGGDFYYFNGVERRSIARLEENGTLDSTLNLGSNISGNVRKIGILSDGKIFAGGAFTLSNSLMRTRIAKLNLDGSIDPAFATEQNAAEVFTFAEQPDGKIVIGGSFNVINYLFRNRIARLNGNGTTDVPFAPAGGADEEIFKITQQPDGKVLVGGEFGTFQGFSKKGIVRLNQNGTIDHSFNSANGITPSGYERINNIIVLPDGKILIGGEFNSYAGVTGRSVARLNSDGSPDASFTASLDAGYLNSMVLQPDGKILIGGNFPGVNGNNSLNISRLNADGSVDSGFASGTGASDYVSSIALQPDGKILIGGNFNRYNNINTPAIIRLNSNGTIDTSFNAGTGPAGSIGGILVQPDGKILVRGFFESFNGISRIRFARLNSNGSVDTSFDPGAGPYGLILDFDLQPNGKILIAGTFTSYNNTQRRYIARINSDGSLDPTAINGNATVSFIRTIFRQPDGAYLVGGDFNAYSGIATTNLIRLKFKRTALFDFDGDGRSDTSVFRPENGTWYLQQSQNGFTGLAFGTATDKLVPADYDGDGKTDVAVYRSGTWYMQRSQAGFTGITFGDSNDIPVPADYDGDGKTDLAIYRPSNGYWYILNLVNNQFTATLFGINVDKPVPADYDGDGKADIAVNRNGVWYLNRSSQGFTGIQFGDGNDKLVPADYDGDGKTDLAVFRPSNGVWYLQQSTAGFVGIGFGLGTDTPVAADYDGDGKADLAVVRNGSWYLNRSSQGFTGILFGTSTDLPVPNAFVK